MEGQRADTDDRRASAIILAGGMSRRLGRDKALLRIGDQRPLIEVLVERLRPLVAEVIVVADDGARFEPLPARVVPDSRPQTGALGGLYTGLLVARTEYSLVVGCDMPFLNPRVVSYLLGLPRDYDALLPCWSNGFVEPLHAVYSTACLPSIRAAIELGARRLDAFLDSVRLRRVAESEIRRIDPDLRCFFNVNTPADLERAIAMAAADE